MLFRSNGIPNGVVSADGGASRLGIERFGPVVTRAVLIDVARHHGVEWFEDAYPITSDDLDAIVDAADIVVEAASQQAVKDWGETILKKGFDLMVIATGAYGDPKLWKKHKAAAEKSGARLRLPSGAIAGLDGLLAMRLGKLEKVKYTSIKPPHAWSGTPAETDFDLPSIKTPTVIFRGTPADAGRLYPKNANLAVTVALCGAGLDRTEIELVADPTLPEGCNASKLEVVSDSGELNMYRLGRAMPDNPKTGVLTALTMADDLMKIVRASDW